ncbi:GntR family transcriptional regulator [soil metagenome]
MSGTHITAAARPRQNKFLPLYHQVEQLVRQRIVKQQYVTGAQIPSEHELCRELSVSRVTVRQALQELVREGTLIKVQGKGTFVAPSAPAALPPIKYTGTLDDLYERVLQLDVVSVETSRLAVTPLLRSTLNLTQADVELCCIRRVRHIKGEPFSYTVNYLPLSIGERVRADALYMVPLNAILEDEMNIPIIRALETVEAAPADQDVAKRLQIPVLYPVMHVKRVMYTLGDKPGDADKPFELVETFYRADKYQYSVSLSRVQRDGRRTWAHQSHAHEGSRR